MEPREICRRIREEHALLREQIAEIHALSEAFVADAAEVGKKLRERGLALLERLEQHLELEDTILAPALRAGDVASGTHRAERLAHEHHEQRELLRYLIGRLGMDSRPTVLVARELRSFAQLLREDMNHEEENLLREELLAGG